jgi:hypothetical protein
LRRVKRAFGSHPYPLSFRAQPHRATNLLLICHSEPSAAEGEDVSRNLLLLCHPEPSVAEGEDAPRNLLSFFSISLFQQFPSKKSRSNLAENLPPVSTSGTPV